MKHFGRVLISNITIDKSMIECLKGKKPAINLSSYKNINSDTIGKLERIDHIIQSRIDGVSLPPVKLNKTYIYVPPHKRNCNDKKFRYVYNIIDGRHRVTSAILFGKTEIDSLVY